MKLMINIIAYKDDNNIIWFFDVGSLKLIELKQANPYTMIPFNDNVIYRANKIIIT